MSIPKTAIEVNASHINVYPSYFKENTKIKLKTRTQKDINKLLRSRIEIKDSLLHRDKLNRYYILLVYEKNNDNIVEPTNNVCSLDPGCKSMFTGYSSDVIFKIESRENLRKLLFNKISHIQSLRAKKRIKRKKLLSKILNIYDKIKNIVSDIHWKTISFLRKSFSCILLPSFESQKIVGTNTIKSVRRNILSLRHYDFKQKLRYKIKETKNLTILDVNEAYTTKTCSNCGSISNVGFSRIFKCHNCSLITDRDVNAAKNIYLRYAAYM